MKLSEKIFGTHSSRELKRIMPLVDKIEELRPTMQAMTDEELKEKVRQISVYARVSPEHKIRIVRAWQENGCITAMTGDGVNDAPALKQADIGIAMGITGTEVSKDAAAMILTDDNFATIVKAVANGRNVYTNIKNSIGFLLSGNLAGILVVMFTSLMGLPLPFTAVQLLFRGANNPLALRKRYRDLIKIFHPDNLFGDGELAGQINKEYLKRKQEERFW